MPDTEAKRGPVIPVIKDARLPVRRDPAELSGIINEYEAKRNESPATDSVKNLAKDSAAEFLNAFAISQLETYPDYGSAFPRSKESLLNQLNSMHPADSVPQLITTEPGLMASNLDNDQLLTVLGALKDLKRAERTLPARAVIEGIIIGRLTSDLG